MKQHDNEAHSGEIRRGPAFRQLASVLARAPVPPVPADFARRMQQRVDDLSEQSKFEQATMAVLGVGMAIGAAWQLDFSWLRQMAIPTETMPMLFAAGAACAVAWLVDRAFADR